MRALKDQPASTRADDQIISGSARFHRTVHAPLHFAKDTSMASFARAIAISTPIGAAMLVSPLAALAAGSGARASPQPAQAIMRASQAAAPLPEATRETVGQRITTLRAALKITPDKAASWNGVRSE
jgi:hypothetical protein